MILLSSPLKMTPPGNHGKHIFFLEIEIFTTKIVNSKDLKKICRQLLSTMNVYNRIRAHDLWVSYLLIERATELVGTIHG